MRKQSDGGLRMDKVPTNNTDVYEIEDDNYRVQYHKATKKFLFFEDSIDAYKIFIPKGSVKDDFTVDLDF